MRCVCMQRHNEQQIWEMGDLVPTYGNDLLPLALR